MIQKVMSDEYIDDFIEIYNSANELYEEGQRHPAAREVFEPQFLRDENYVFIGQNNRAAAFMSYYQHPGFYELTSLYVMIGIQRSGVGGSLLSYFESLVPAGGLILVKALKASPWAVQFYCKHGYAPVDDRMRKRISDFAKEDPYPVTEKPWSILLYKELFQNNCCFCTVPKQK